MPIKKLLEPKSQTIIEQECNRILAMIANSEGSIYIIDNEHIFLWWMGFPWDLSDRDDMLHLLKCPCFDPVTPGYRPRDLIDTFTRFLTTTTVIPMVHLPSDPSIPKCAKKSEHVLDLQRWLAHLLNACEKEI